MKDKCQHDWIPVTISEQTFFSADRKPYKTCYFVCLNCEKYTFLAMQYLTNPNCKRRTPMSNKKEWRDDCSWPDCNMGGPCENYSKCRGLPDIKINEFVPKEKYEAEKQRAERAESRAVEAEAKADSIADRFKSYRRGMILEYKKLREQADRLEKENQKLKEALATSEGQEQKLRQALKEIVNTERMNDPNNLLAEHLKTVAREALK